MKTVHIKYNQEENRDMNRPLEFSHIICFFEGARPETCQDEQDDRALKLHEASPKPCQESLLRAKAVWRSC